MKNAAAQKPSFRLRFLLDPSYVARKLREIGSIEDFLQRTRNVGRYGLEQLVNLSWDIRGIPRYARTRSERLFYAFRGAVLLGARGAARGARGAMAAMRRVRVPERPSVPRAAVLRPPESPSRDEALATQFQEAKPFKHVVVDEFFPPEFCRRLFDEFPEYDAERFRNEHRHLGKAHHEKLAGLGPAYAELDRYFQSSEFLARVGRITGIPDLLADPEYMGGGTHENLEDMELDPHVDFTLHPDNGLHRRVNLLFYLNSEWDESWGGALELHVNPWLPPDRDPVRTIPPLFNRCVIFETGDRSWHGFKAIRLPPEKKGLSRRSIAVYLYTREDPRGILSIPPDLTVFVDRHLPPEFKPGRTLTEEDMRLLSRLITRRDWKLEYLYGRAIGLFNQWRAVKTELEAARRVPAGAASRETASSEGRGAISPPAGSAGSRGGS